MRGKINILTICTGKYTIFFQDFYNSCENHFLKGYDKKYFVFTDGEIIESDNIVRIQQSKLGWPYDTMMRFKMFNTIKDKLDGDFTFFFNANMKFLQDIGEEALPNDENNGLMGVTHPGYFNVSKNQYPYERRFDSKFYIPYDSGNVYYQGCFNGGKTDDFMNMSSILESRIDQDLGNGIVPLWHDESALNWYYKDKNPLTLDISYAYPESELSNFIGKNIQVDKKILQVDKNKYGGHQNLRK